MPRSRSVLNNKNKKNKNMKRMSYVGKRKKQSIDRHHFIRIICILFSITNSEDDIGLCPGENDTQEFGSLFMQVPSTRPSAFKKYVFFWIYIIYPSAPITTHYTRYPFNIVYNL